MTPERLARIDVVLTDVDGTLTAQGLLWPPVVPTLAALRQAGVEVVAVTGRSAGWCDHFARQWPLVGVVGEGGAFWFSCHGPEARMVQRFFHTAAERAANAQRLAAVAAEVLRHFPEARPASDQPYRLIDYAIDYSEDVGPLPLAEAMAMVQAFRDHGVSASMSGSHVNAWIGDFDKLTMTRDLLTRQFGLDVARDNDRIAYIGDSLNDEPMFAAFANSVGVANVRNFADRLKSLPRFVTLAEGGAGFVEFADRLRSARGHSAP
jgi:hypothetical protein